MATRTDRDPCIQVRVFEDEATLLRQMAEEQERTMVTVLARLIRKGYREHSKQMRLQTEAEI